MSPDLSAFVENSEHVARILHREWIVDGVLQVNAFALSDGETYISVNRPVVETFAFDMSSAAAARHIVTLAQARTRAKSAAVR